MVLAASAPLGAADEPKAEYRRPHHNAGNIPANRKLTDEDAVAIRYLVGSGKLSQRAAALEYGVSKVTIAGIMANRFYVEKPKPPKAPVEHGTPLPRTPATEAQVGRHYGLFPPKRRSA